MTYDLKITGGTLLDGTGRPAVRGDLAVRDGRIVAVGEAPGAARQTLDAGGLAVAPGFIDIHTHYDAQVLWDPRLTISPWHGVTTVVMGNCGFGVAPTRPEHRGLVMRTLEKVEGMSLEVLESGLSYDWPFVTFPEYLDALEARGPLINVGVMIGHTPLRLLSMGEDATGAAGIWMGTRFIATREAYGHDNYKRKIVAIDEGTVVTRASSGTPCRFIRNDFTRAWEKREAEIQPFPVQFERVGKPASIRAREQGDLENGSAACGQSAGLIHDVRPAREVVDAVVAEARAGLAGLGAGG